MTVPGLAVEVAFSFYFLFWPQRSNLAVLAWCCAVCGVHMGGDIPDDTALNGIKKLDLQWSGS